jgi:predicted CXXCH cytochrome family protein
MHTKKIVIFIVIGLLLMTAGLVVAQEPTPLPTPTIPPQDCQSCHLDVAVEWQFTSHAQAYSNESFQTAWFDQRSNPTCLACHTTSYEPRTETYQQAGVACVACHGDTPLDHPPSQVATIGGEVCADCHTTTYSEWEQGAHSTADITCISCHDPHQSGLVAENSQALCTSCHEAVEESYSHITHPDQQCVDCHYHAEALDVDHFVSGNLRPTGHQAKAFTVACTDCHENLTVSDETLPIADSHSTATIATVPQDASLPLIQGVLLGGGLGVTVVAFLIQIRRKRR